MLVHRQQANHSSLPLQPNGQRPKRHKRDRSMTRKFTATIAATAIAMTGFSATPSSALTDEELFLLFAGAAALAIIHNASTPPPAPTPAPAPVTYSTGPIKLKQTFTANLDNGNVGGAGSDLWFQAATPTKFFLKPINGAKMAVGNKSNRGFAGCSIASYSSQRVKLNQIPVGSYVCMKTGAGRISQFRMNKKINGPVKKIKIGYTTWQ